MMQVRALPDRRMENTEVFRLVVIFTEGEFNSIQKLESLSEARAFVQGLHIGANLYGAGSCRAYVLPEEDKDMSACENAKEVQKALESLASASVA